MTKHFKTDNVIVRKFNMRDVEQVYLNLLPQNNLISTQDESSESTKITDENTKKKKSKDIHRSIKSEKIKYQSIEQTKLIVKSAINEYYTDEPTWAVEDKANKRLVGSIRVTNYSAKNKMCNITWTMSYKYWDNNFMKDALTQIFKFLFTKKGIELIECSYYEQDSSTNVILDEIGMTKEATLRDRRFNEQTHKKENFVIYSINKEEFFKTAEIKTMEEEKYYKKLKRKV